MVVNLTLYIDENVELYRGATITDTEAEGELFTHYVDKELNGDKQEYMPMGGVGGFEQTDDPDKMEIIMLDVFNYNPRPTPTEANS